MLNIEDKLLRLVSDHLKVENTLEDDPLILRTSIYFRNRSVYTHDLDLSPLIPILREKLNEDNQKQQ